MDPKTGSVAELERQLRHASFFTQASLEQQGKLAGKLDFDNMIVNEEFVANRARPAFHFHPSAAAVPVTISGRKP